MMLKRNRWAAALLVAMLAALPAACGDSTDGRVALEQDELNRELELALQGDSSLTSFEDTEIVPPAAEAPPVRQPTTTPRPQQPPRSTPQPRPAPQTTTPTPTRPTPDPIPDPTPRVVSRTAAVGTSMTLVLNETLSTEVNQPGDAFTATLRHPVLDSDGNVVIPAGAVVRGQITQVQKSGRVGETAVMNLAFSSVSFNGKTYPLNASVQQANPERQTRQTTGEQVGKAAAGAAAGAILGRILGKDTKSTVKGAVIGAAAGTAIAMGTADVDAVLPAGSEMIIRVDSPVTVTSAG
jgi:hypothetical protein